MTDNLAFDLKVRWKSEEPLVISEQGTKIPQRQEVKVRVVHENISPGEVYTKS